MVRSQAVLWGGIVLLVALLSCRPAPPAPAEAWPPEPAFAPPAPSPSPLPPPSPAPTAHPPLRLQVGPGEGPRRLTAALVQALAPAGCRLEVRETAPTTGVAALATLPLDEPPLPAGPRERPDLYLGYDPPVGMVTWPLTRTCFVPVVPFWLPVQDLSWADLIRIFQGQVRDWAALGAPTSVPAVPLYLLTDPLPPLPLAAALPLSNTAALWAALRENPGGIALVPLEQVEVGMRALRLDGRDTLLEGCAWPDDPLARPLFLAWSPALPEDVSALVRAFGQSQMPPPPPPAVTVALVGDIFTGRAVSRRIQAYGGDYTRPFTPTQAWLSAADLTIANLEGVLSDRIEPPTDPYTYYFVGSGHFTAGLCYAGVDAVSLANNHSMNFGSDGMSDTLSILRQAGIVPFGAGMDLAEARRPALFEIRGTRIALLGYDAITAYYAAGEDYAGTAPADPALVAEDIADARRQADIVIVYFHWGWEYTHAPSPWQQELAHQAVSAGADVVVGSHPHWVQGLEHYQDGVILYSLGNFIADQMWSDETTLGVMALLIFRHGRLVGLRLQAVQIADYHQPRPLPPAEAEAVYRSMQEASPNWPD